MLHIERIREDINTLGRHAAQDQHARRKALSLAQTWLEEAPEADQLRLHLAPLLDDGSVGTRNWHGGIPCSPGRINQHRPTGGIPAADLVLIGVDGS